MIKLLTNVNSFVFIIAFQFHREELLAHYAKLTEQALRREEKAMWIVKRHELDEKRKEFLKNDETVIAEGLESLSNLKISQRDNTESVGDRSAVVSTIINAGTDKLEESHEDNKDADQEKMKHLSDSATKAEKSATANLESMIEEFSSTDLQEKNTESLHEQIRPEQDDGVAGFDGLVRDFESKLTERDRIEAQLNSDPSKLSVENLLYPGKLDVLEMKQYRNSQEQISSAKFTEQTTESGLASSSDSGGTVSAQAIHSPLRTSAKDLIYPDKSSELSNKEPVIPSGSGVANVDSTVDLKSGSVVHIRSPGLTEGSITKELLYPGLQTGDQTVSEKKSPAFEPQTIPVEGYTTKDLLYPGAKMASDEASYQRSKAYESGAAFWQVDHVKAKEQESVMKGIIYGEDNELLPPTSHVSTRGHEPASKIKSLLYPVHKQGEFAINIVIIIKSNDSHQKLVSTRAFRGSLVTILLLGDVFSTKI